VAYNVEFDPQAAGDLKRLRGQDFHQGGRREILEGNGR
jgi:hypothetical protein